MTLNSSSKSPKFLGRVCAAALIMGGLAFTVPTTYASEHPEPEVKVKSKNKSVMKWSMDDDDGEYTTFVITDNDGDVEAYEIDPKTGKKTMIDPKSIDARMEKMGIPTLPKPPSVKKMSEVFADIDDEDGKRVVVLESWGEIADFAKLDELKSLSSLKDLKALEKLSELRGMVDEDKIEAWAAEFGEDMGDWGEQFGADIEVFAMNMAEKFKDGDMKLKIMIDDEDGAVMRFPKSLTSHKHDEISNHIEARLRSTRDMLNQTARMLEDTPDMDDAKSELMQARKELKKAQKALKAAEKAMRDAED